LKVRKANSTAFHARLVIPASIALLIIQYQLPDILHPPNGGSWTEFNRSRISASFHSRPPCTFANRD
jgi:hypothetical protein